MDLNAVRERINAIDDQIVDLFVERMKASADVASAKAEKNLPVLDLRREQAVLEKVMERGGEELKFISISCIRQFSISARAIRRGF